MKANKMRLISPLISARPSTVVEAVTAFFGIFWHFWYESGCQAREQPIAAVDVIILGREGRISFECKAFENPHRIGLTRQRATASKIVQEDAALCVNLGGANDEERRRTNYS